MNLFDTLVIILYFLLVAGLGLYYRKLASKNLESYFLSGKSMHWLALSMFGSVATFDISGTMWMVSMLFLLGMKSFWVHWMWGVMMGAFFMTYMGKWVRRSNVMTGAEWMITRFGDDRSGQSARTTYALMAVITQASFIGYAFQGIGKFAAVYIPLPANTLAVLIVLVTTFYVLLGGFYSAVITNVIQTVILIFAGILITVVAYRALSPEVIAAHIPQGWTSILPVWRIGEFAGTVNAPYEFLGALVIVWVLKGFLLNAGGPAQMYDFQTFLAARNPRDASKLGAAWSLFLIIRWGMVAGITLLALAGFTGITDPEQVMPMVLRDYLPMGLRGLVIAGLLAAFMSTFGATVNSGASYIVRDFWLAFFRPDAPEREQVRAGYISTVGIVIAGVIIGYQARSIAQIWNWIMMALGAGVLMPNFLRWYWWRMNGWGYAAGTLGGIILSLAALFFPEAPMYVVFPPIAAASLAASVAVSLATPPVDRSILVSFYRIVRPFGFWRPVRAASGLSPSELNTKSERLSVTLLNVLLGMVAITGFYLFPMYLVGHWHTFAWICLGTALAATVALAFTWYPNLPGADEYPEQVAALGTEAGAISHE
ncbi:MAG: sodium:solute symporter family transporter [Candidatus Latescibacterota bacterium]